MINNFGKIQNLPKMRKICWIILQIMLDGGIISKGLLVEKHLKI